MSLKNNTVSKAKYHFTGNKSKEVCSDPMLLNKDIFPSVENLCPPCNGVDIRNGRESYSETQQHGDSQLPSESLYSRHSPVGRWKHVGI